MQEWSISALCREFGMARNTLLKRLGDTPYRFDADSNAKLYMLRDVVLGMASQDKPVSDIDVSKARKAEADASLAEIRVGLQRGDVFTLGPMEREFENQLSSLRAKMLSLPRKMGPLLDLAEGVDPKVELLDGAMRECLEELSLEAILKANDGAASGRGTDEDYSGATD